MNQFVIRVLLAGVILSQPVTVFAQAEILLQKTLEFLIGYGAGKALDSFFDSSGQLDVEAFEERLRITESQLLAMDSSHASAIAALRRELDARTSRERIEEVVQEALRDLKYQLEGQIREVDERVKAIDDRANQIMSGVERRTEAIDFRHQQLEADFRRHKQKMEECFGYLPRLAPTLNLTSNGDAILPGPIKEPLLLPYCKLLAESEQSRRQIDIALQLQSSKNEELQRLLSADDALVRKAMDLNVAAKSNLAIKLLDRKELAERVQPQNPALRDADIQASVATWLVGATEPVPFDRGVRLGVPKRLFENEGSDLLASLKLVGGDPAILTPIFTAKWQQEATKNLLFVDTKLDRSTSLHQARRNEFIRRCNSMMRKCQSLIVRSALLDRKYRQERRSLGELHPDIVASQATQRGLLNEASLVEKEIANLLRIGTQGYLRTLPEEKPTHPPQIAFRDDCLKRLAYAVNTMECLDWKSETSLADTWQRLVAAAEPVISDSEAGLIPTSLSTITRQAKGDPNRSVTQGMMHDGMHCRIDADASTSAISIAPKVASLPKFTTGLHAKVVTCLLPTRVGVAFGDDRGNFDFLNYSGRQQTIKLPIAIRAIAINSSFSHVAAVDEAGKLVVASFPQGVVALTLNTGCAKAKVELVENGEMMGQALLWDAESNVPKLLLALDVDAIARAIGR